MTEKEKQWLYSLSVVSLLGPVCDVDNLIDQGFFKKPMKGQLKLADNLQIDGNDKQELINSYLKEFNIRDMESYLERLQEMQEGDGFSANVEKLIQLGRTMDDVTREIPKSYIVNGHPYLYDFFEVLMSFEFHWPKYGFRVFDLANGIMLVRLGLSLGWLTEGQQEDRLEAFKALADKVFEDYRSFGEACAICREVYCRYLKQIGSAGAAATQKDVLSIAYHSIWEYM